MTYREARSYMQQHLQSVLDDTEMQPVTDRVLEHISGKSRGKMMMEKDIQFEKEKLDVLIHELKNDRPVQYVLGFEYFGNLIMKVNEAVLIPRPETLELCEWIRSELKHELNNLKVLDIGTGSGCIPVYLKYHLPVLRIEAWDISSDAIEVAKENAQRYNADIFFQEKNLFEAMDESGRDWDIIVSNPPYISVSEKDTMQLRVLNNEPHEALFVTDGDELQFYKGIMQYAERNLKHDGRIFLEIHQDYALATQQLFLSANFQTELRKDMYGNNRMLKVWR